jgi:hypothetical protein
MVRITLPGHPPTSEGFRAFGSFFGSSACQCHFTELILTLSEGINKDEAERLFSLELAKTTVHFGEGRINPATIACVYAKIEENITGRPIVAPEGSADAEIFFE